MITPFAPTGQFGLPAKRCSKESIKPACGPTPAATALSCDLFTILMPRTERTTPHMGVSATTALTMPAALRLGDHHPTGPNDSVWMRSAGTLRRSSAVWTSAMKRFGPHSK